MSDLQERHSKIDEIIVLSLELMKKFSISKPKNQI